jgi:hypothetical protein
MPAPHRLIFPQDLSRIIQHGLDLMAHILARRAYACVRSIVVEVGVEVLQGARAFAVERATRCVSFFILCCF